MSKMDTQGMSTELTPEERAAWEKSVKKQVHKPAVITPRRLFTETMVKELKILINEVLDEREHKKSMKGPFDDVKTLPPSYFDTEHFRHYVGEDEPPYTDWSQ